MADFSPAALQELVKQIAHQAIEVELRMEPPNVGWSGSAEEGFWGQSWEGRLPPVSGPTGPTRLRWSGGGFSASSAMLPGMTLVGQGFENAQGYYEYEIDAWASIYEPWMTRIEAAFEGWDDLPDPADFQGPVDQVRAAVTALTPQPGGPTDNDPDGDYNTNYVDVDLDSALSSIQTVVGEFAAEDMGLLISAFLESYGPTRVRGIMFNQGQAAIVLGMALLGEQKIWEGARKDIMAIAEAGKAAMRPGGAGGDPIDLAVALAFVDVFKTFLPGPVQTAIDTTEGVLDIVTPLIPQKPESPDSVELWGWSPDEVATSIEEKLDELNKKIYDSESEIAHRTLDGLLDYMWSNAATQFHINPGEGLDPDLQEAKGLRVHPESLKRVGYRLVPSVAAHMARAAKDAQAADDAGMWARSRVGIVASGPYLQWTQVLREFDKVTTGSASELVDAGRRLAVGAGWARDSDGDARRALKGLEGDVARGEDGWDNSRPAPVPGYYDHATDYGPRPGATQSA